MTNPNTTRHLAYLLTLRIHVATSGQCYATHASAVRQWSLITPMVIAG